MENKSRPDSPFIESTYKSREETSTQILRMSQQEKFLPQFQTAAALAKNKMRPSAPAQVS